MKGGDSTAARAVAEARCWLGTPYVHQGSCRGAGADCLGLIRGIWRHLYGSEPCTVPPYSADWAEAGREEALWAAAHCWLLPKLHGDDAPGDILLFRIRQGGMAKHLGIQAEIGGASSFIHAYSGHSVTESPLSIPWRRRIAARFTFPVGGR